MADPIAKEIRLFTFGANETEKGTFFLTKSDASKVLAAYQARGTDLSWDYEHAVTKDTTEACPAAAWCSLEVRGDGLWATNIRWTARARALLEAKEYRYFSPFFEHTEDGHILNVINVALTNIPATHGIAPLVAASALASRRGVRGAVQQIPRGKRPTAGRTALSRSTMDEEQKKKLAAAVAQAVMAALADGEPDGDEGHPEPDGDEGKDAASAAAALCIATGEKNPMAALAKLLAGQAGQGGGEQEQTVGQRVALAVKDGKITPALKPAAETWTHEQLTAYLGATKGVPTRQGGGSKPAGNGAAGASTLSAHEKHVAKQLGQTPEQYAAAKAKLSGGSKLCSPRGRRPRS